MNTILLCLLSLSFSIGISTRTRKKKGKKRKQEKKKATNLGFGHLLFTNVSDGSSVHDPGHLLEPLVQESVFSLQPILFPLLLVQSRVQRFLEVRRVHLRFLLAFQDEKADCVRGAGVSGKNAKRAQGGNHTRRPRIFSAIAPVADSYSRTASTNATFSLLRSRTRCCNEPSNDATRIVEREILPT
jgi:hypothetical protein